MTIPDALQSELDQRPPKPVPSTWTKLVAAGLNRPHVMRLLLQYVLPPIQPFVSWLIFVVWSRREVREVMERDDDFTIGPQYGPAMVCGDFVFSTDRGPFFREDTAFLWETFYGPSPYPPGPLPAGGQFGGAKMTAPPPAVAALSGGVKARVNKVVEAAGRDSGQLDLVQDVLRLECCRMVQEYLGVGPPDEQWIKILWEVLGILALQIILPGDNKPNDPQNAAAPDLDWAKKTLRLAIAEEIDAASAAGQRDPPNIIARMYAVLASTNPVTPAEDIRDKIIRNISGLAITICHPTAKAAAHAVDALLSNREAFHGAAEAAKAKDEKLFWDFIEEALRFFPAFPIVIRACPRATVIGADSGRPRKTRAGQKIVVGLLPAMFDPAAVPFPDQFRTDRGPNGFLVFGYGKHACFGYRFAREMLIALLMPLFARGFTRAPGHKGKLRFDLVMPQSLQLRLSSPTNGAVEC